MDIVKLVIEHDKLIPDVGLEAACRTNNTAMVDLLIKHGARDWSLGLFGACIGNHAQMVLRMLRLGAKHVARAFSWSCLAGNDRIVKILIKSNVWKRGSCLQEISRLLGRHIMEIGMDIYEELLGVEGAANIILENACTSARLDLARLATCNGATNIDECFRITMHHKNTDILQYLVKHAQTLDKTIIQIRDDLPNVSEKALPKVVTNKRDRALAVACSCGNLAAAETLAKQGADVNRGLLAACGKNYIDVARMMISFGANSFDKALRISMNRRSLKLVALLLNHGGKL
jgi:ankyrin repeat protein